MLGMKRYGGRIPCPHCGSACPTRSSRNVSPTYFEQRIRCSNDDCGWIGVASVIIERTTTQSAMPRPSIKLPLTAPRRQPSGLPMPANDDARTTALAL